MSNELGFPELHPGAPLRFVRAPLPRARNMERCGHTSGVTAPVGDRRLGAGAGDDAASVPVFAAVCEPVQLHREFAVDVSAAFPVEFQA